MICKANRFRRSNSINWLVFKPNKILSLLNWPEKTFDVKKFTRSHLSINTIFEVIGEDILEFWQISEKQFFFWFISVQVVTDGDTAARPDKR